MSAKRHTDAAAPPATGPRPGAPAENENATKSGASAWLKSGSVPRCYRALRRQLRDQALGFADELVRVKGRQPTLYESCVITTVIRHAGRVALLERWLAREHKDLGISDRLALLKEIGAASTSRDKALQSLGLDLQADDSPWAALDAIRAQEAIEAASKPANARDAKPVAQASNSADAHLPLPMMPFEGQL